MVHLGFEPAGGGVLDGIIRRNNGDMLDYTTQ